MQHYMYLVFALYKGCTVPATYCSMKEIMMILRQTFVHSS